MNATMRVLLAILPVLAVLDPAGSAADIEGSVIVNRRLTRPRVTAAVPLYQRGAAVGLPTPVRDEDPLAVERSKVVIYLEGRGPATPGAASIEQRNREFVPEMLVIPAGSTVNFPNMDPIFHNIFSLSKPKAFDLGNYRQGETRTVAFQRPGIVYVNCHLHPNMAAAIVVTPNDWAARADRAGHFAIHGVAPGRYTVVAWHKTAGFFRQTVEVSANGAPNLEFLIPLPAEGAPLEARN